MKYFHDNHHNEMRISNEPCRSKCNNNCISIDYSNAIDILLQIVVIVAVGISPQALFSKLFGYHFLLSIPDSS